MQLMQCSRKKQFIINLLKLCSKQLGFKAYISIQVSLKYNVGFNKTIFYICKEITTR